MSLTNLSERLCRELQVNQQAMAYLRSARGIDGFTITDLGIGYCNWDTKDDIGVNLYGRITFPVYNLIGDPVTFGGRILPAVDNGRSAKYLNGAASPIYDKSRVLYNLYNASDYILKAGSAIVVEGYMDVAALWQSGIRNVVATCGTAFTKWHLRLLKRYAEKVFLVYDDDLAGANSSSKAFQALQSERFPLMLVKSMDGMDPDEYIRLMGKDAFLELLNEAKSNQV